MGNFLSAQSSLSMDATHRLRAYLTLALTLLALRASRTQLQNPSSTSVIARVNQRLRQYEPVTLVIVTALMAYLAKHLSLLLHLNAPIPSLSTEPDMHYSPSYTRARHFLNAWDAGVLSTLPMKKYPRLSFLRHSLSFLLALYYLVHPHDAEAKILRFRSAMTVEQLRAVWQKGSEHPVLRLLNRIGKTRIVNDAVTMTVAGVECHLYYDKALSELASETALVIDYPGGGFVAMDHRDHSDYLCYWASKLAVPLLAVNMRKAPEFPFPAGLNDCFAVYREIVTSEGATIGMNQHQSQQRLRLAIVGDSAGGNFAAAVTLKAIDSDLRVADGVVMVYPCLDCAGDIWRPIVNVTDKHVLSSRANYLSDGVLPTSYQVLICRSYITDGTDPRHHYISPLRAPASLLAKFPPVFITVGDADPLYDDSVSFIDRVRSAHNKAGDGDYESELHTIPKVSHAFLHIASLLKESREAIQLGATWLQRTLRLDGERIRVTGLDESLRLTRRYSSRKSLDKIQNNPTSLLD